MGRYTGPKGRINRRLGAMVFENGGAIRALDRKEYPPGMSQRRRKVSNYGLALREKQKIKYFYGLREKQLRKYFDKARKMKGNTGEEMMVLCERRLDNAVRRAGFTLTRPQARQGLAHGHFQLNGRTVSIPSITVRQASNTMKDVEATVVETMLKICSKLTAPSSISAVLAPGRSTGRT